MKAPTPATSITTAAMVKIRSFTLHEAKTEKGLSVNEDGYSSSVHIVDWALGKPPGGNSQPLDDEIAKHCIFYSSKQGAQCQQLVAKGSEYCPGYPSHFKELHAEVLQLKFEATTKTKTASKLKNLSDERDYKNAKAIVNLECFIQSSQKQIGLLMKRNESLEQENLDLTTKVEALSVSHDKLLRLQSVQNEVEARSTCIDIDIGPETVSEAKAFAERFSFRNLLWQ
ncbi:hypothetical protein BC830DRAFT_1150754 [Chytriomyces sp. MP71]|nr:hypothetical protein BC830DRAFT_1154403 [Chytriomyces sp. MP71]KAI8609400.1 hypothetical protein BC830DRAFT_1150754 [Chytriomyces sp. MP71]